MNGQEIMKSTKELEKEIANILIDSSLYLGMSPAERKKLLCYLVSSYFDFLPAKNSRSLSAAMQTGPMR